MFANETHAKAHEALKAGEVEKAIQLYTDALKEHPDHLDILSDRGVAYIHANDKDKCFADLDRAIKLQPKYSYRYASRAYAKNHFGDLNGAVEDYTKAVELDPDDAVAQNNLGLLLEQQGYQKEANDRFERADKLSKLEDELYKTMDDLESKDKTSNEIKEAEDALLIQDDNLQNPSEDSKKSTTSKELKKVFTSKKQFREFIRFIRNGFKLK